MIAIIAGHKGKGTGAIGYLDEGEETIVFRNLLIKELHKLNIPYLYDNQRDDLNTIINMFTPLLSNKDIIIDIHFNSSSDKNTSGTEVFIPSKYNNIEEEIAIKISSIISNILNIKNRGVKTEDKSYHKKLAILRNIPNCINILIEICFCTNKKDCITYNNNKELLAINLAKLIKEYV